MDVSLAGKNISYRRGYKYQLAGNHFFHTSIKPAKSIRSGFVWLNKAGVLYAKSGYAWDGASGPTWDDKTNMRGSLIHDALYQLMRLGLLPHTCKESADREMQKACIEDGMNSFRAWYYYQGVRFGGGKSSKPGYEPYPVLTAP